jgi:hypothetical protein
MTGKAALALGLALILTAFVACNESELSAEHEFPRGVSSQKPLPAEKAEPIPVAKKAEPVPVSQEELARMQALGRKAARGDLKVIDELQVLHVWLYRDIDYNRERKRVLNNLKLMRAAFGELGKAAGSGSKPAMRALMYANTKQELRSWTPNAFGIAAGMGNAEALDVLLNYKQHSILLSSTVFAMKHPAQKNNPAAVDFLIKVLEDTSARALWHGASSGLTESAKMGNERAATALKRYEDNQKKR